jgi:hypothetical protein
LKTGLSLAETECAEVMVNRPWNATLRMVKIQRTKRGRVKEASANLRETAHHRFLRTGKWRQVSHAGKSHKGGTAGGNIRMRSSIKGDR